MKDELHTNAKDSEPQTNASGDPPPVTGSEDASSDGGDTLELAPGPLSKEARNEAQQLGNLVIEESERIARTFKKSRREIMLAAGLSTRPARGANRFNMFRRWYAHQNPMKNTNSESIFIYNSSALIGS